MGFCFASTRVFGYILIGVFLSLDINKINLFATIIVLIFTIICFSGPGIIAAIIILFKKGAPISWFVSAFFSLFGGTYFPIEVLPVPLQYISYLLPITYSLRSLRLTILKGHTLVDIKGDLFVLIIYSVLIVPISILFFKLALRRAKINGSLMHY